MVEKGSGGKDQEDLSIEHFETLYSTTGVPVALATVDCYIFVFYFFKYIHVYSYIIKYI